jgi:hypothetical protein
MKYTYLLLLLICSFFVRADELTEVQKQSISPDNLLINGGFESGRTKWTIGAGTFTSEASIVVKGNRSAKIVLSAQTMSLTQSSTLYAAQFADGVQGLAMVRVKSDVALSVCSIQAGTVSTTNCVAVAPSNTWGLYKIPFVFGATSQGISIASSGAVTGTVYIDDAFVGAASEITDLNNIGPWISYTPTFTGFGTVSAVEFKYRQNGENLDIRGTVVAGTPTAVEARISLPTGFTSGGTNLIPSIQMVGRSSVNTSSTTFFTEGVMIEPSVTYMVLGAQTSTTSEQTKAIGTNAIATGGTLRMFASIPVQNLAGSSSVFTKQCNNTDCESVLSARVVDSGASATVSNENLDFINGNCTNPSTGTYVCSFNSGIFSLAPNCEATVDDPRTIRVTSVSNTSVTIVTYNSTTAGVQDANGFSLMCQKQGVDYQNTRKIVGTFSEVVTAPGIAKPKECSYAFGGAGSTLSNVVNCTTGTCTEVYDSCNAVSPPAFASTGTYTNVTFANGTFSNNTFLKCYCETIFATANSTRECNIYWDTGDQNWSTNASGGAVINVFSSTPAGAAADSGISLKCESGAP